MEKLSRDWKLFLCHINFRLPEVINKEKYFLRIAIKAIKNEIRRTLSHVAYHNDQNKVRSHITITANKMNSPAKKDTPIKAIPVYIMVEDFFPGMLIKPI